MGIAKGVVKMGNEIEQITEKFYQFLAVMFGKDNMNELEAKERLYFIKYIREVVFRCLEAKEIGQIPILEITVWATHDGKTNVTVDPNANKQILEGWELSKLVQRVQEAINEWDKEDIGKKAGKVIDMMHKLGWIKDVKPPRKRGQ